MIRKRRMTKVEFKKLAEKTGRKDELRVDSFARDPKRPGLWCVTMTKSGPVTTTRDYGTFGGKLKSATVKGRSLLAIAMKVPKMASELEAQEAARLEAEAMREQIALDQARQASDRKV